MKHLSVYWQKLSITRKFSVAFGVLLGLIILIATTSSIALTVVKRQTENAIITSTKIQSLVLEMDRRLETTRRLETEFLNRYPSGFEVAKQTYALQATDQISVVIALSGELQTLIEQSDVSQALDDSQTDLNFYLSAADRYEIAFEELVELIATMVAPEDGLQPQLGQEADLLQQAITVTEDLSLLNQYHEMRAFEKDYWAVRQRSMMQSAFNVAFDLQQTVENDSNLSPAEKRDILKHLDTYQAIAQEILLLDVDIRSKINEFDLQIEAIAPISETLIARAEAEVEQARVNNERISQLMNSVLVAIALAGVILTIIIAIVLNNSITRNVVKLTAVAAQLQDGNLSVRAHINSTDELGQLADTFNTMAVRIDSLVDGLEQQVAERTQRLEAILSDTEKLYQVSRQMVTATDLNQLLTAVAKGMAISGINRAILYVFEYDNNDNVIGLTAEANWYSGKGRLPTEIGTYYPVRQNSTFLKLFLDPNTHYFNDLLNELHIDDTFRQMAKQLQVRSLAVFPLWSQARQLGVLLLEGENPYHFTERDLHPYQSIIGQLAAAVENRLLLKQLEQKVAARTAELLTLNQQLQSYTQELENSNQELQNFAYIASHDLQEPLRKIQTFGDRLDRKYGNTLNEQGRDYLARMCNAAARSQTLIEDLLAFSRVSTTTQSFESVNLDVVVTEVLSDMEISIEAVEGQIEVSDLPILEANKTQMRQLFQNLISNALKFHRDGIPPIVQIECKFIQNGVNELYRIVVADNGIGFDTKHLDRIFTVFQRLHTGGYDGTGVGLAICRRIVERHQGTITAHSKPGQGASFVVMLPLHQG